MFAVYLCVCVCVCVCVRVCVFADLCVCGVFVCFSFSFQFSLIVSIIVKPMRSIQARMISGLYTLFFSVYKNKLYKNTQAEIWVKF